MRRPPGALAISSAATMASVTKLVLAALSGLVAAAAAAAACCQPGQACWPTPAELEALEAALDPSLPRSLVYAGPGTPFVAPLPAGADQPLYGAGETLRALYVREDADNGCTNLLNRTEFCQVAARNNAQFGWSPALIAWPTTDEHVQLLVEFANAHDLCVCVAGTGHDFLNRHSCDSGLLVRTSLFKQQVWDPADARGLGRPRVSDGANGGTVTLGAGITFSEAHESAARHDRALASGWSPTVGIAGWTLGGGHGPFNNKFGLGADQLRQVTIVLADGGLATAGMDGTRIVYRNGTVVETGDTDLLWALRGGGSSTWGIITSFTLQAHPLPEGGFTYAQVEWAGDLCDGPAGEAALHALIDGHAAWALARDADWSGLVWVIPYATPEVGAPCDVAWYAIAIYWYQGANTTDAFLGPWNQLVGLGPAPPVVAYSERHATVWSEYVSAAAEAIYYKPFLEPQPGRSLGGVPSVVVGREQVADGRFAALLKARVNDCRTDGVCVRQEVYQGLTGNLGAPQDPFTAVNPGMRTGLFHWIATGFAPDVFESYYALGAYSYFSESAYDMPDWRTRLWGDHYDRLAAIKAQVDPHGRFGCHHCVGDTDDGT